MNKDFMMHVLLLQFYFFCFVTQFSENDTKNCSKSANLNLILEFGILNIYSIELTLTIVIFVLFSQIFFLFLLLNFIFFSNLLTNLIRNQSLSFQYRKCTCVFIFLFIIIYAYFVYYSSIQLPHKRIFSHPKQHFKLQVSKTRIYVYLSIYYLGLCLALNSAISFSLIFSHTLVFFNDLQPHFNVLQKKLIYVINVQLQLVTSGFTSQIRILN